MLEIKVKDDKCRVLLDGYPSDCMEELVVGVVATIASLVNSSKRKGADPDEVTQAITLYVIEGILKRTHGGITGIDEITESKWTEEGLLVGCYEGCSCNDQEE